MKKFFIAASVGALLALILTWKATIGEMVGGFLPKEPILEEVDQQEKESDDPAAPLPTSVNLDVAFASQAPFGDWAQPYQDACEEAALIMAHYYVGQKTLTPELMKEEILKMVEWENWTFGYYKDTSALEMVQLVNEFYGYTYASLHQVSSVEDIKEKLAAGQPVVLPVAGRLLHNPHFTAPGPVYHVIILKGYDDAEGKFISHDPGTRFGEDYAYGYDVIMNAIHDWNSAENILEGEKVMITLK